MDERTKKLKALDRRYVWHPFTQMREWMKEDPLVIEKGRGNYLIDTEGNRYLDGVSSLWVTVHGHRKREIDRAVKAQIDKISHSTLLGLGNVPSIELAERLVRIAPKGLKRVFYSDDGSTAVEIALKISFQYWEQTNKDNRKRKFIAFTGAYHGDTFGSMSVGEIDIFVQKYRPLLFHAFRAPYPYCYRCPVNKKYPDCKTACLGEFEKILAKNHEETAACIIEPLVQGAAGMVVSPSGFLKGIRRLTKKYNVHLIADEVATGFGRTGKMFACDVEGVSPDILCLAKGLTGGYLPLAATLTTEKIFNAFLGRYDEFKSFFHGHTYTGNPLGCAAAIANLEIFEHEKVIDGLKGKMEVFTNLLEGLKEIPHVGDVRHRGLMAGVELVKDKKTKRPYTPKLRIGRRVCLEARNKGLIIRPIGDTLIIMPPLSIKKTELRRIFTIVRESIREVT
ncbi:MAG: adenosylmethionine--8-amino-7-oxononanoate transaminase [Thermodesulfobacteriota bacterium]